MVLKRSGIISECQFDSNSLVPDQAQPNVGPCLGLNCLQMLLADNKILVKENELKLVKVKV